MSFFTRFRRRPADSPDAAGRRHPVAGRVITVLACLFVLFALIAPNQITTLTPAAFVRIPLEGLLCVVLVLVLPARAKRIAAVPVGVILGLLAIVKVVDIGFSAVLARPFNLVFDWPLFGAGVQFLHASVGVAGAIGAAVVAVILALAVLVLMTLSIMRLTRLVVRHNARATGAVAVLGVAWVTCAALGAQLVPGVPVAGVATGRLLQVQRSLADRKTFAKESAVDAFAGTPDAQLLTGLRGKDVLLAFVESYGRNAIESPKYAPQVDAVLDAGSAQLRAAGFGSRSAFLTSPTAGGGSWLAHSTLLSGLWINNQQRYDSLVKSHRLTLSDAFRRAGWHTAAVMPGTTGAWPEASFYGYQQVYDRWTIGYRGPRFNWGTPPDQFNLSAFQRLERAAPGHAPVMAELPLVTSHAPWAPTPSGLVDWNSVGDGSVFGPMAAAGDSPEAVWRSPGRVRTAYRKSIEYTLNALVSYVRTYGDDNLVLVFLGDHQPAPIVTGQDPNRDVPITIVAKDPKVLEKISGWGWQDGLRPGAKAPVWPMKALRDRFLTAFGTPATAR
ncbi:sulfatase [Actinomadura sp. DC4]|uniref:sulfatase n=1 Tax=Actinomadura sp. DC4 TaxID=3055069 RepID=UPI0025B0C0FA|nr:sulfatase [Actinomadura sp. DC4]MDN3355428.1 sulfatase [Actinomadura sp. DC4]